VKIKL